MGRERGGGGNQPFWKRGLDKDYLGGRSLGAGKIS